MSCFYFFSVVPKLKCNQSYLCSIFCVLSGPVRTIFGEGVSCEERPELDARHALAHLVDDVIAGGQVSNPTVHTQLLHTALEALRFLRTSTSIIHISISNQPSKTWRQGHQTARKMLLFAEC